MNISIPAGKEVPERRQLKKTLFPGRLLHNTNFPNFYVGKINLILGILHVCLWSNLFSALNLKKFALCNNLPGEIKMCEQKFLLINY